MRPSPSRAEVEAFVELNVVPPRREEPRLAEALAPVERHMLPSRQGAVAAWRVGEGPAVLLVHGYADDHSLWSVLIEALIVRRRPLVVLDLPAHGYSEGRWGRLPVVGAATCRHRPLHGLPLGEQHTRLAAGAACCRAGRGRRRRRHS